MGLLQELDNARRVAGRNLQDLFSDPSAYAERLTDRLRNMNAGVTPTVTPTELTNRPQTLEERVEDWSGRLDPGSGMMGVIKPRGGNWLSGKFGPEEQFKLLKKPHEPYVHRNAEGWAVAPEYGVPMPEAEAAALRADPVFAQNKALNSWIDNQLTKYVKNDMAAPTDPIRKLADAWPEEQAQKLALAEARVQKLRAKQQAQAATRGVPEEYLTQTRQDILAAEEARDLIAENTGLHIPVQLADNPGWYLDYLMGKRADEGFPVYGMAKTPLGRQWEMQTDSGITPRPVKDFLLSENLEQDPWLAKADPNTRVNTIMYGSGEFKHLTDELYNSLREGRITPEQLAKMPVDQAVRHVAEINALRKVNAAKQQAMDASEIPVFKDYPEQGLSWRQLKSDDPNKLQKWLTQEGDAMGHCVGGYCDDVASGQSNIYSLRDAKGKPYVTIETSIDKEGIPVVQQVKGPNNQAPDPKFYPQIQDFIKQGKWGEINDLHHTGLNPLFIDPYLVE